MSELKPGNFLIQSGILAAFVAFLGNLWVTQQRNEAELQLEKLKHDSEIILQAIDTQDIGRTREMLTFILDAGLIDDSGDLKEFLSVPGNLPATRGAIACYTNGPGGSFPVVGFIDDIPGHYEGRIFKPKGYEIDDLGESPQLKALCHEHMPEACPNETTCWAGGDTGGYYGFQ